MKDPREVIIRPVITEHSYDQMEGNTFTFEVAKDANKVEIRQAIEAIFDVTVVKVNTLNVKPKPKRVRYQLGKTRTWKKAMVTLKEGDTIEVKAKSKKSPKFKEILEATENRAVAPWLSADLDTLSGKVIGRPTREDIDVEIAEHLIVELYSK